MKIGRACPRYGPSPAALTASGRGLARLNAFRIEAGGRIVTLRSGTSRSTQSRMAVGSPPFAAAITALTMASRSSSRSFSASIVILCRVPFAGPAGFPDCPFLEHFAIPLLWQLDQTRLKPKPCGLPRIKTTRGNNQNRPARIPQRERSWRAPAPAQFPDADGCGRLVQREQAIVCHADAGVRLARLVSITRSAKAIKRRDHGEETLA